MRVLALETSGCRGSVALVESAPSGGVKVAASLHHNEPQQHAERLLHLLDEALSVAGWTKSQIDRIAVGVGPGSFAGIRVGLSLAQGLMLGLGVEGVGVGSLRALARGLPNEDARVRVAVRDARRNEYFLAAYDAAGEEVWRPHAALQADAAEIVLARLAGVSYVVVGTPLPGLPHAPSTVLSEPDASAVGLIGIAMDLGGSEILPDYVRGPDVVVPRLPPSPLDRERQQ